MQNRPCAGLISHQKEPKPLSAKQLRYREGKLGVRTPRFAYYNETVQQFDLEIEKKECHKDYILSYSKILCQKMKKRLWKAEENSLCRKKSEIMVDSVGEI